MKVGVSPSTLRDYHHKSSSDKQGLMEFQVMHRKYNPKGNAPFCLPICLPAKLLDLWVISANRHEFQLVLIVVARWSKDMFVIIITFGIPCTAAENYE